MKHRFLIKCNDSDFDLMFKDKVYNEDNFSRCDDDEYEIYDGKNFFYDLWENDLPDDIDLVMLDGPNGNGRSISFLHLQNKLKDNSFIFIDDYHHYDFLLDQLPGPAGWENT